VEYYIIVKILGIVSIIASKEIRPERDSKGEHFAWHPHLGIALHIATRAATGM